MLRLAAVGMGAVLLVGAGLPGRVDAGSKVPITVAGQQIIAIIDANDNGELDEDDCTFRARSETNGANLTIEGTQDDGPNLLRACTGKCYGSGFVSAGFGEAMLESCQFAHPPFVPLRADFCSSLSSCQNAPSVAQPAGNGSGPLVLRAGSIFRTSTSFNAGFGQLCSAGGPAVEITGDDGVKVLRELFPFPPGNPTHMCVSNVPVQLESNDQFVNRTACFPVSGGVADFAFLGSEGEPFARVTFEALPACGATAGVPTTSQLGLAVLLLALLLFGVRTLSRRRGFAEVLPLL